MRSLSPGRRSTLAMWGGTLAVAAAIAAGTIAWGEEPAVETSKPKSTTGALLKALGLTGAAAESAGRYR